MNLEHAKKLIIDKRKRRIRKDTYPYVEAVILQDTAPDSPFRDRLVIDWWARAIDPLEAESYDQERLRYFRERMKAHKAAPRMNAAIRQGAALGRELRRLTPDRHRYIRLQLARLSDRKLNYVAVSEVVDTSDRVFEQLTLGIIALEKFKITATGLLRRIGQRIEGDERFDPLATRLCEEPSRLLPDVPKKRVEDRVRLLKTPHDFQWHPYTDFYFEMGRAALIRKLEAEYINKIS